MNNDIKLSSKQANSYSNNNNKGFDIRSNKEIEVADMIKEKNKLSKSRR